MSKKVTTEDFIRSAKVIHGDRYDYSMTEYKKSSLKVKIRCIKHDFIFEMAPNSHISAKGGCPICRYENVGNRCRKPQSLFIENAIAVHKDKFDYSLVEYLNGKTKIKIRCIQHNILFEQTPSDHLKGKLCCPTCKKEQSHLSQRGTTEDFIKRSKAKFPDKFDYSETVYTTAKEKLKLRCVKHDLLFDALPDTHLSKNSKGGCPQCKKEAMGQYHRMFIEEFAKRSTEKHNGKYDYSHITSMKNMHDNVPISCDIHGIFYQTPTNHLHNGFGCAECATIERGLATRLKQEDVIRRFKDKHGDKYDYSKVIYTTIYEPVRIYCNEHQIYFDQVPSNHFVSSGCKLCVDKGYSRHKAGYLYINKVSENIALKVGITNICPIERAKVLGRKSDKHIITNLFYFYHEDGDFIYKLEQEILSMFETGVVPKVEMSSGYTETVDCCHLPEIIDVITLRFNQYPNSYAMPE